MPEPNGSPKDKSIASTQSKKKQCSLAIPKPELTMDQKITYLVKELATRFNLTVEEIGDWLKLNRALPKEELWQLLTLAKRYGLNPILGQIDYERDEEGVWQLFITVDGWIALLHQQPTFTGLTFTEANEVEDGIPLWMQCTIYHSDKTVPITVKEYFCEVRSNHPAWQTIPRRMLRHKTLQEAVRLAFGISTPSINYIDYSQKLKIHTFNKEKNQDCLEDQSKNSKQILKEKLLPEIHVQMPNMESDSSARRKGRHEIY